VDPHGYHPFANKQNVIMPDRFGHFTIASCGGDEDCDGVGDAVDQCRHTPPRHADLPTHHAWVWKDGAFAGCASDEIRNAGDLDRDGVANSLDKCPGTAPNTLVLMDGVHAGCSRQQRAEVDRIVGDAINETLKKLKVKGKNVTQPGTSLDS
jgi:hypothetical protein